MNRTLERWTLLATILASSMAFIDGTALNVAIPALQNEFKAGGEALLWILNSYLLILAAFILVGGSLGDKLGRKRIFMLGISLFMLASLACGLAPSIAMLIAARTIQGLGGALMIPGSLAIITATVPADRRGRAIGTWSMFATIVTVVGPLLGGVLSDAGLWRGVFLINLPMGIIALLILHYKVPESRDEESSAQIDYAGAFLAAAGLAAITYGFIGAPEFGYFNLKVYGTLITGSVLLILFVFQEYRFKSPMLPLSLFRSKTFTGTNLLTLFLYGALSVGMFLLSLNMVQIQRYAPSISGLAFLPFASMLVILARISGSRMDRFGPRIPLILGPAVSGLGFLLLSFVGITNGPSDYWRTFLPGVLVLGTGMGITVVPLTAAVMGSVPQHFAGTASGVNNAITRFAGVLAIAIVGSVAISIFSARIESRTANLRLSDDVRVSLRSEGHKLGAAEIPSETPEPDRAAVAEAIRYGFADAFQVVMIICAILGFLSSLVSLILIS